jgi:hypothetical protein
MRQLAQGEVEWYIGISTLANSLQELALTLEGLDLLVIELQTRKKHVSNMFPKF